MLRMKSAFCGLSNNYASITTLFDHSYYTVTVAVYGRRDTQLYVQRLLSVVITIYKRLLFGIAVRQYNIIVVLPRWTNDSYTTVLHNGKFVRLSAQPSMWLNYTQWRNQNNRGTGWRIGAPPETKVELGRGETEWRSTMSVCFITRPKTNVIHSAAVRKPPVGTSLLIFKDS